MNQVAWMLDQMPAEAAEYQWERWVRRYWQNRLDSIPMRLTDEEASAMAAWIMHLTNSFEEGVGLATAHRASLDEHADVLHDLDDEWLTRAPAAFAKLLAHLLRDTKQPFWGCHNLATIVPRLRQQSEPGDLTAIIEEAMRLGCSDAPEW